MIKYLPHYFLIINLIGFLQMGWDKRRARKKGWRVKESTLLLTAALGSASGSYLGMKFFRHKTKRLKFKYGLPLLIVLNLICLSLLFN